MTRAETNGRLWVRLVACCSLALIACDRIETGTGHRDPVPVCTREHCNFDVAYISGNLTIPSTMPVELAIQTCTDGRCDEELEIAVGAEQYALRDHLSVFGSGVCAEPPFICHDTKTWWIGWTPAVATADGGVASSFRIVIRDAESGDTLEDHSFDPSYEVVEARSCIPRELPDGSEERVTCRHFIAEWN